MHTSLGFFFSENTRPDFGRTSCRSAAAFTPARSKARTHARTHACLALSDSVLWRNPAKALSEAKRCGCPRRSARRKSRCTPQSTQRTLSALPLIANECAVSTRPSPCFPRPRAMSGARCLAISAAYASIASSRGRGRGRGCGRGVGGASGPAWWQPTARSMASHGAVLAGSCGGTAVHDLAQPQRAHRWAVRGRPNARCPCR